MAMKYIKLFEGWKLMEAEDDVTEFNSSKPGLTPVLQTTIKNFNDAVDDNRYGRLIESLLKRAKQTGGAFDAEAGKELKIKEIEVPDNSKMDAEKFRKSLPDLIESFWYWDGELFTPFSYRVQDGDNVMYFGMDFEEKGSKGDGIIDYPVKWVVVGKAGEKEGTDKFFKNITLGMVMGYINTGMTDTAVLDKSGSNKYTNICNKIFGGEGAGKMFAFAQTIKIGGKELNLASGENGDIVPLYVAKDVMGTCGFDFNKATLTSDGKTTLSKKELMDLLTKAEKSIEIIGHTDSVGKEDVNLALSKQRAESVLKFLQGLPDFKNLKKSVKVTTSGQGFKEMIADDKNGKDKLAAAKNRRVVIKIDGVGPDYKALFK